ncbi:MAG TPA: hypothetical protein VMF69_26035 [Gemmataceae bacterium]|nr:hypothetical protein [Gemmataceae bacterium]
MTNQAGQSPDPTSANVAAPPSPTRALLDTTVQLDRRKTETRKQELEALLARFDWKFSTGISLVEFKATVIQECLTIHNQLRRTGARYTRVRDALLEKQGQQISLRAHIFNNILQVFGSSFDISEDKDRQLAERARLLLENIIPQLFNWFAKESVDAVLNDRLACDRAKEPPRKKHAAFEVNLPECKRGKNKHCNVEDVIREEGPQLMKLLEPHLAESLQLQKAETSSSKCCRIRKLNFPTENVAALVTA